ncbi:hypothetical protein FRB96_001243 [Tulasnella sp. 330]|nr:hypothetical protein FRB96_001243 [Tulasnella sp. 330]
MFYDLNVPFQPTAPLQTDQPSISDGLVRLSAKDQAKLDAQLDILIHLGYTVIALNQTVTGVFNPKTHRNTLQGIRTREGIVILRRLTIILTEESEKGSGLVTSNFDALKAYDLIALCPTTPTTFQHACLTYSVASPITAHIITFDLQANQRLPFFMKLSLVRTAIKNGAVFEIRYCTIVKKNAGERARRNWWINAKDVVRATGGKGLIFAGGGLESEVRAPTDVINLAFTHLEKETRQTYRAVLSQPRLILTTSPPIITLAKKRPLEEEEESKESVRGAESKGGKRSSNKKRSQL